MYAFWKAGTECAYLVYDCIVLISIFHFVYVAWFGQQEAREKWQLMKLLPADVNLELLEAVFD